MSESLKGLERKEVEQRKDIVALGLASVARWGKAIREYGRESQEATAMETIASRDWHEALFGTDPDTALEQSRWIAFRMDEPEVFDAYLALERAVELWRDDHSWFHQVFGKGPIEGIWDGTEPGWIVPTKAAILELDKALGSGIPEHWIMSSDAARYTKALGREITTSTINAMVKQKRFRSQEVGSGSRHKLKVETGSFFRWYFQTYEHEIRHKTTQL